MSDYAAEERYLLKRWVFSLPAKTATECASVKRSSHKSFKHCWSIQKWSGTVSLIYTYLSSIVKYPFSISPAVFVYVIVIRMNRKRIGKKYTEKKPTKTYLKFYSFRRISIFWLCENMLIRHNKLTWLLLLYLWVTEYSVVEYMDLLLLLSMWYWSNINLTTLSVALTHSVNFSVSQ